MRRARAGAAGPVRYTLGFTSLPLRDEEDGTGSAAGKGRGDRAEDHSLDPALPLSPGEDHLESLPEGPLDERCRHVTGGEHIHVKIHFYLAELGAPFLQQRLEAGATLVDGAALLRLNDVDCTEYRPLLGRRGHTVQPTVPGDGIVEGAVPVRGKVRGHAHPRD